MKLLAGILIGAVIVFLACAGFMSAIQGVAK